MPKALAYNMRVVWLLSSLLILGCAGATPPRAVELESVQSDSFEHMSLEDILSYLDTVGQNISAGKAAKLTERLYEIAYFDHNVSDKERQVAKRALTAIKATTEQGLADHPETLRLYRRANKHMEDGIPYHGYGSLGWYVAAKNADGSPLIPPDQIVPFVSREEVAHLLPNFLVALGHQGKGIAKREILKHVILNRGDTVPSAVTRLYGLAARRDKTLLALLNRDEFITALHTPSNYQQTRKVLVSHGLLPQSGGAAPLHPELEIDQLVLLTLLSNKKPALDWKEVPELLRSYHSMDDGGQVLVDFAVRALRFQLIFAVIGDIYGKDKEGAVRTAVENAFSPDQRDYLRQWFAVLAAAEREALQQGSTSSLDVIAAAGLSNFWEKDIESNKQEFMSLVGTLSQILNFQRVKIVDHFRFVSRYFVKVSQQPRENVDEELFDVLMDIYVKKGSFAAGVEREILFEDWIGLE